MLFQEVKKLSVGDHAVFDNLGQPAQYFLPGKGAEDIGVDVHGPGLVKGPHQIFAFRDVDPCFAAHGAVHLGQEGGRDLNKRDAAHVQRGQEAGNVAGHAPAKGNQAVLAVKAGGRQCTGQPGDGLQVLAFLAAGKRHQFGFQPGRGQGLQQGITVQGGDMIVADHPVALGDVVFLKVPADQADQPLFDPNGIASLPQTDLDQLFVIVK